MSKRKILDEILKQANLLRDKKGKKLTLANGLCGQLYFQAGGLDGPVPMLYIISVVKFFIGREELPLGIFGFLPELGKWTPARKKLVEAMITGLEDPKVRRTMTVEVIGF